MRDAPTLAGPRLEDAAGIGALTLGGLLMQQCARFADHDALVFDDPLLGGTTVRWTYRDLEHESRRIAKALLALGIGKGGRVGVLMGNRPEAVAALFGAALAGAVAVPLSTFAPKPELSYLLAHADISVLLLQTGMGKRRFAADVADLCPSAAG
ncbi:MAG TPA: AMP-binding protein, partial [Acidimicrobiales bacterium]|nr:AMP-binding protein [Acidimicrobiales bacterium]